MTIEGIVFVWLVAMIVTGVIAVTAATWALIR
jgi:hypothetical protein